MCTYNCVQLWCTVYCWTVLTIFPLILQTIITAQMMSVGGEIYSSICLYWEQYCSPPPFHHADQYRPTEHLPFHNVCRHKDTVDRRRRSEQTRADVTADRQTIQSKDKAINLPQVIKSRKEQSLWDLWKTGRYMYIVSEVFRYGTLWTVSVIGVLLLWAHRLGIRWQSLRPNMFRH